MQLKRTTTTDLRWKASIGASYMIAQAFASRGVTLATQITLAWLLVPEAFGVFASAASATALIGLITNPGLDMFLLQRGRAYPVWVNPAF